MLLFKPPVQNQEKKCFDMEDLAHTDLENTFRLDTKLYMKGSRGIKMHLNNI